MRYLTLGEVVELHRRLLQATSGTPGIRDLAALESAIAQPKATFAGVDLYPTLAEKAAALGFSPIQSHAAMETFLVLSGFEIDAPVDDQERLMLDLTAGRVGRSERIDWLRRHLKPPA